MGRRGLDAYGYLEREGSLGRVQAAFVPVVVAARERIAEAYGHRLHSGDLYGSIPRGTARPGRSDLLLALHHEPGADDPAVVRAHVEDLGPWLADEYTARIGTKTPRAEGVQCGPARVRHRTARGASLRPRGHPSDTP